MKLTSLLAILSLVAGTAVYAENTQPNQTTTTTTTTNNHFIAQDDTTITQNIKSYIEKNPMLSKSNINVTTKNGVVTLSGNADSDSQVSTLVEFAQSSNGVKDVDTNINVKDSKQPLADTLITAKIKGLLIREEIFGTKDIASVNMSVETQNGIVYLTGVVDNQEQIKNAIKLIEGVQGVKKVEYSVKKQVPANGNRS